MLNVIVLAVHVEDQVDFFGGHEEPLSIIEGHTRFNKEVNEDLLIISLVVIPIPMRFHVIQLLLVLVIHYLGNLFIKRYPNQLIIPLFEKFECVPVSQLNLSELFQNL